MKYYDQHIDQCVIKQFLISILDKISFITDEHKLLW